MGLKVDTMPAIRPRFRSDSRRCLALAAALIMLGGCLSTTVEVDEETPFPVPLVNKIPITVGLHLPEALLSFQHSEDHGDDGNFTISIGEAQRAVFENLFDGMFESVVLVDDPRSPGTDLAGIIVPTIAEMQFSTPTQTRTDYFEVWLRYHFQLYGRDGGELGDWDLTAYGKANTQNYGLNTTHPTLHAAALQACRDAMAFFTVQFTRLPVVQQWLSAEIRASSTVQASTVPGSQGDS